MSKLLLLLLSLAVSVIVAEAGLRVYYALRVGPDVLYYGIFPSRQEMHAKKKHTVMDHENVQDGYSKYLPHQKRVDYDRETGDVFDVIINNLGFRGTKDIGKKNAGAIRVVSLGTSSTFGYASRDDETYPFYLEELLNEMCKRPVEVLNLGVPHLDSGGVRALFTYEALPLEPDIVTYYQGANDTVASSYLGPPLLQTVRRRLLLVKFLDERLRRPQEGLDFAAVRVRYLENVAQIQAAANANGALFVVANQQAKSGAFGPHQIRGITYAREVAAIEENIRRSGSSAGANLLYHWTLMEDLERWATDNRIPFVDVIAALDYDRDTLVSWVHLSPRGNRMIARAFAKVIRKHACAGEG